MADQRSTVRSGPSHKPKEFKRRKCARYRLAEAGEATWVVKGDKWMSRVYDMSDA